MPPVLAIIPAIISGITGGLQLAGVGQPSPGDAAKQAQQQEQQAAFKQAQQDSLQRQKMILGALPGAQEQTGGNEGAPSLVNLASVIAGLPGENAGTAAGHGALASYLGLSPQAPTQDTMTSATYGLSGNQG